MTAKPLRVLVTCPKDNHGLLASSISEIYKDTINISHIEFTTTLHRTIKSLEETDFDLCFIDSTIALDDLPDLFQDYELLKKELPTGFVYIVPEVKDELPKIDIISMGFIALISKLGTHQDKEELKQAVAAWEESNTQAINKIDVKAALKIILKRIDDTARDIKRNIIKKIDRIPAEFIEIKSTNAPDILASYFAYLEKMTETSEPENNTELSVPTEILQLDLPKLEKNKYTGASSRVWKRLLRMHGVRTTKSSDNKKEDNLDNLEEVSPKQEEIA